MRSLFYCTDKLTMFGVVKLGFSDTLMINRMIKDEVGDNHFVVATSENRCSVC